MKNKYDSPVITVEELTKADVLLASGTGGGGSPTYGSTAVDNAALTEEVWGTMENFV